MQKLYFAHPVSDYGGPRQVAALRLFAEGRWAVVNPDTRAYQIGYAEEGMPYFLGLVEACDALAFLWFPDGAIGTGVGAEIAAAFAAGLWVAEVCLNEPARLVVCEALPTPVLSVVETRHAVERWSPLAREAAIAAAAEG